MSEITKLYENANIEKEVIKGCYEYYSELGIDIWKENDCRGKNCNTCKADKSIKEYPPFTAEKQLNLIILLANREIRISPTYISSGYYLNDLRKITSSRNISTFEDSLAQHINAIWQDLTEEERKQIKEILK